MPRKPNDEEGDDGFFHRDDDDDSQGGGFMPPDPVAAAQAAEFKRERMLKYVKKHSGLEDDEIATLFKDDAKLEEFYNDLRRLKKAGPDADDDSHLDDAETTPAPEDSEDLTGNDARTAHELSQAEAAQAARKAKRKQTKDFLGAAAHLPPDQRPGEADMDSVRSFLDTLGEDDDEDDEEDDDEEDAHLDDCDENEEEDGERR